MIFGVIAAAVVLLLLILFLWWQNNWLEVDEYTLESPTLPPSLDGCRIVHLSDLHNKGFGPDQKRLVAELEKAEPDLILITGDIIDKRRTREDTWGNALNLVRHAARLAPVFYVSGNHEWESGLYKQLRPQLETLGAEVLDNGFMVLDHGEAVLSVMGLSDPAAFSKSAKAGRHMVADELPSCAIKARERLEWLCSQQDENAFRVLISHRPNLFDMYAESGVHLVFCGHAHGGQVRLPWIGALFAPEQGWHPQYTEGPYILDDTVMIVSRGLGNSGFPFRIFNRPQVVVVTLHAPSAEEAEEVQDEAEQQNAYSMAEETLFAAVQDAGEDWNEVQETSSGTLQEAPVETVPTEEPAGEWAVNMETESENLPETLGMADALQLDALGDEMPNMFEQAGTSAEFGAEEQEEASWDGVGAFAEEPASVPDEEVDEEEEAFRRMLNGEFPAMNELPDDLPEEPVEESKA